MTLMTEIDNKISKTNLQDSLICVVHHDYRTLVKLERGNFDFKTSAQRFVFFFQEAKLQTEN